MSRRRHAVSLKLGIAVSVLLLPLPVAVAQAPSSSSEVAPTREEVMKFLEVTQAKSRVAQMLEGMSKQARLGAERGCKQKMPDATPEQLARVDAIADSIFKEFSPDELIEAIVPIYQRHLSKSNIDAILAFYASPAGQTLLRETPAILASPWRQGARSAARKWGASTSGLRNRSSR
jgi:hypothetical protein